MILKELKKQWWKKVTTYNLESETTIIQVKGLKPEEAIGKPSRTEYPLLKGREVMLQATIRGAYGQAFTDAPSEYIGNLSSLYLMPLNTNRARALLVAAINATYRYLNLVTNTQHCRDEGPELCGRKVASELLKSFPNSKIAIIGFQPALTHHLSRCFKRVRVTDMDLDNIGRTKEEVAIESYTLNREVIAWSDIIIATGSTINNNTIDKIIAWSGEKQLFFYGVTVAAAAHEFHLKRFCFETDLR